MRKIYLDHNSTTPIAPEVLEAMLPYLTHDFGNPASQTHSLGWSADAAIKTARKSVAQMIQAQPNEIVFTSGATEGNNLVLQGFVKKYLKSNPGTLAHIITSDVEHSCVQETLKYLAESSQVEVTFLKSDRYGRISLKQVQEARKKETILVSLIWGNNEIGTLNPISEISQWTSKENIAFHTDATQVCGKLDFSVQTTLVDFLSFSAHKMYGPKGSGALYLRRNTFASHVDPIVFGGGQENGLRSGTLNVPSIVGFGKCCELFQQSKDKESQKLVELREIFLSKFRASALNFKINGHPEERLPGHLSLTFPGVRMDRLIPLMPEIAISSTSACASGSSKGSHVLYALGLTIEEQYGTLRIGLGRTNQREEVEKASEILIGKIKDAIKKMESHHGFNF